MSETMIKIEHISKAYRLGAIGGGTLRGDLQSFFARVRGKEDPNTMIGQDVYARNQRFLALDDVSFSVSKGERVGIIGHNGAGKSTLLKLLSRVTAPTTGSISYNGRIASMLEVGTGFHPELTGRENVYLNGAILGMSKAEIAKKFDDIVRFAEMEQFIDTPVKRYSSGMYVKLAFAVAAHLDADILVMDEVLAVGDMKFQQKCLGKMDDVSKNEGRTVLYVSHNMNTIRQFCTRCIVLDHGKLVFDGDVEEGIRVYIEGQSMEQKVDIDVSQMRMNHLSPNISAKMLRIKLLGKTEPAYNLNEPLSFELTVRSVRRINNLSLRLEIRSTDEVPVGASLIQNFSVLEPMSSHVFRVTADIMGLVPGHYLALLVIYEVNQWGTYDDLDAIYPAFFFSVEDAKNQMAINWNPIHWGKLRFKSLEVEEV